ncbi:MAG: transcription-repair coupling factor, partial [Bacteroidaceae bacterium]|nr:transcription-repair coupling factor [Bacteroidaceae bacterium]
MEIKELQEIYASHPGVTALRQLDESDYKSIVKVNGLTASSAAVAIAGYMHKEEKQTLFIIMNDAEEAGYFYHDLVQICGDKRVLFFPSSFKRALKYGHEDDANRILRTEVMSRLASRSRRQGTIIVTHPEAIAEKVVSQEKMESNTLPLAVGGNISREAVEKRLGKLGFKEVSYVYEPGEFAVRGSLIDIFSFSSEYPFRIDFFGDEIESIRTFEVETQLSKERMQEISIVPKLTDKESVPIVSFLPRATIYIAKDFSFVKSSIEKTRNEGYSLQARLSEEKLPEMPELMSGVEIERHLKSARRWEIHPSQGSEKEGTSIAFDTSMQPLFNKDFDLVSGKFKEYLAKGYKIMLLADDARQSERLKNIFDERGDEITFTGINKTIHAGYVDNTLRMAFFTDHQLFGRFHNYRLRSDRARGGKAALTLKELSEFRTGDYIVHIDHGVGKFGGLVRIPSGNSMQEAIKLLYKNDDVVF